MQFRPVWSAPFSSLIGIGPTRTNLAQGMQPCHLPLWRLLYSSLLRVEVVVCAALPASSCRNQSASFPVLEFSNCSRHRHFTGPIFYGTAAYLSNQCTNSILYGPLDCLLAAVSACGIRQWSRPSLKCGISERRFLSISGSPAKYPLRVAKEGSKQ